MNGQSHLEDSLEKVGIVGNVLAHELLRCLELDTGVQPHDYLAHFRELRDDLMIFVVSACE